MTVATELDFKNYYVEKLYMTADVETGVLVNRSGRRMIALTNDFLIGLHRALEIECGDRVQQVLYHCGRKWGRNFGKGLDGAWSEFYASPAKEFPLSFFESLLIQEFGHNGWGILSIDYSNYAKGVIELTLEGAVMADILSVDPKYPADVLTAGILSGLFSHFVDKELDCLQSQCAKQGVGPSQFVLSDAKRIADTRTWNTGGKSHHEIVNYLLQTQS